MAFSPPNIEMSSILMVDMHGFYRSPTEAPVCARRYKDNGKRIVASIYVKSAGGITWDSKNAIVCLYYMLYTGDDL